MQDFVSKLEQDGVDEELMLSRAYSTSKVSEDLKKMTGYQMMA